jgi:hypothetical protein
MQKSSNPYGAIAQQRRPRLAWNPAIPVFEERLNLDSRWALAEGSKFFEGQGAVQETLRKITARLRELGIPYAVVGGMALFHHGLRRFTEDVDLLVTGDGLKEIHDRLDGFGYLPPFSHSKNLRDTDTGVKIEFLVTGGFPGDGKPKPVSFPDPVNVSVENDGISYVNLPTLFELKIASGLTNTERMKDLADAQELIKILRLPQDFADKLNPYVREKYLELWHASRPAQKRYVQIWRHKFLTIDAKNIEEMISSLQQAASALQAMLADGVTLDPEGGTGDDYAYLATTDPSVAKKYDMHDETEFWDDPEEAESTEETES